MLYLNARMCYSAEPRPLKSPQAFRLFVIDIFKQAGPPHRYNQAIPHEWMERAGSERQKVFEREIHVRECWE